MTTSLTRLIKLPSWGLMLVISFPGSWILGQSSDNAVPTPAPAQAANSNPAEAAQGDKPPAFANSAMANLYSALQNARKSLSAERLPKPGESKERLIRQMQAFEAYLGGSESENARAWQKFLKWRELLTQMASTEPDVRALTEVQLRYQQNIAGFEYAPFQQMRDAVADYTNAVRVASNPDNSIKFLDNQLEALAKQLTIDSEVTELERTRNIGMMASNLHSANQAPATVSMILATYSQPNVRLQVGQNFVSRAVGRPVAQPNPVDECVLGTHVLGQSFISGNVLAQLQPQSQGVSLRLTLSGNFSSNNIGYNRGVKVYTTGSSPVYASKLITITPNGTFTQPAVASTNLQTQIHGIDHRLRIVERIASKKAAQQKPQANAIGQYRLETRLAKQFNDQIEQQLAQNGGPSRTLGMLNQNRVELVRLGVPKPTWSLASSTSHVMADFKEADKTQLAAPGPSPLPKPVDDIVAEVHQSLPINLAHTVLAGRTLHSWEMDDLLRQYTPDVPEELVKESEGKPWSLTFSTHNPVEVDFSQGLATVSLRLVRMANEDQELLQPATVKAVYRPVLSSGYLVLERVGDVELLFGGRASSGFRSVTLRSFFKGKFDKLFRERTEPRSIVFATRIPNIPQLSITNIAFDQGWAQVTVR